MSLCVVADIGSVLSNGVNTVYNFLLDCTNWPLAFLLLAGGLYFSFRTLFTQVRLFPEAWRVVLEKPSAPGRVSSFGALMVSTASRVGTGNIIGVSTAICLGGPGAVFWMWITALIGGAAAFVESTLAQIYKRRNADGSSYGGPSCYIESACKSKFLAIVFAVALIFTYGVGYNMLASYNLQSSFQVFEFYGKYEWMGYNGLFVLIFGPVLIRVIYELCMMFVVLVRNTSDIKKKLDQKADAAVDAEPETPKINFCTECGGAVDADKKCTKCGKEY